MATITSAAAGLWSATTTWTGGVLPAAGDAVTITHTITYDLNDTTTQYARISINSGGSLIHDNTKPTAIVSHHYIYVNGGTYQAGPNSKTLFYTTSKTSGIEGTGLAGIYAEGGVNNTKLILQGSCPNPETTLSTAMNIGDAVLQVADASDFAAGEFISVYRDISTDTTWNYNGTNQSDEGFIIHHITNNNIYIQQRVAIEDTTTLAMAVGDTQVKVANVMKWQPGFKVWVEQELFTIASVDESNNIITFTTAATAAHASGVSMIETGAQKAHAVGDKVYKIATIVATASAANATSLTVANAAMLNVNDRIAIEGLSRANGITNTNEPQEVTITAVNGNTLTVTPAIPYATQVGYIVTKTNRDCLVSSTDTTDTNRTFIYYVYGASTITGRKLVMRYVEVSHIGNSASGNYCGIAVRGDFNRTDTEREIRGCVVRDGWMLDRCGMWAYSTHYTIFRNNVAYKCYNGFQAYDQNGSSFYNNLAMGSGQSAYRNESSYYLNQFQYNIGTNSQYPVLTYSDYTSTYPEWHNLFRHHERGLYVGNGATGQQYSSWTKNRYEDIQYIQQYVEGIRAVVQDIDFRNPTTTSTTNLGSGYADYDARGLIGGMLVIVNKNMIRGNFEMHGGGGWIIKDAVEHMGNGWSYGFNLNHATMDLRIAQQVYVKYGVPVRVTAYMKKTSAYNGNRQPYILARGLYLGDVWSYMTNVNSQWVRVDLTFTPQRSEMIQIGVGGRGTAAGSSLWIDPRISVTTFDMDLINGPYSVNLMFGLEPYMTNTPGVVLGGGITL
jgi:hypothetical protein